jgi:NAD(P)-dependent dehydrogenase (short-subunit alcohol dehydrogenase family)
MTPMETSGVMSNELELGGQTLVVIGGSFGIGLETARHARAEGASVIITARNADRLHQVGLELGASIAAFDATDFDRLERFFEALSGPVDHVLVTVSGTYNAPLAEFDVEAARSDVDAHLLLPLQVARNAASKIRPGGTLLFVGSAGDHGPAEGRSLSSGLSAALPALTRSLAMELTPVRVNLIAVGSVNTPQSVAALAVHLMTNTAVTAATFEIDGRRELVRA